MNKNGDRLILVKLVLGEEWSVKEGIDTINMRPAVAFSSDPTT